MHAPSILNLLFVALILIIGWFKAFYDLGVAKGRKEKQNPRVNPDPLNNRIRTIRPGPHPMSRPDWKSIPMGPMEAMTCLRDHAQGRIQLNAEQLRHIYIVLKDS